jgi:copper homeostasis protein
VSLASRNPFSREFELCCETLQACEAAAAGGADRIELCTALDMGGVTPPLSLMRAALEVATLPVHVLVRPRGGRFVYTEREFALLLAQADEALAEGAAGIVTGMLTQDDAVDVSRMREVRRLAAAAPVTFHRAIDVSADLATALEAIIDLGCDRVLTSGGAADVITGLAVLQRLTRQAEGRIRVAAGGGVRVKNAASLVHVPGLDLHASLRTFHSLEGLHPLQREFGVEYEVKVTDVRAITELVHTADAG